MIPFDEHIFQTGLRPPTIVTIEAGASENGGFKEIHPQSLAVRPCKMVGKEDEDTTFLLGSVLVTFQGRSGKLRRVLIWDVHGT